MNKEKFFDETFKVLLALTLTTWALYAAFIVFVGDSQNCSAGAPSWLFSSLAVISGLLTAPPLAYGLFRLLQWPGGPKKGVKAGGWFVSIGIVIFVFAATMLALAISHYGCK